MNLERVLRKRFTTRYKMEEELDHLGFVVEDPAKAFGRLVGREAEVAIGPNSEGTEL